MSVSLAYRAAVRLAVPLVPHLLRSPTQRNAHAARLGAPTRLITWANAHRDPSRPLAWFHAPSVGEGLQARAVLQSLRALRPELQIVYTHFSPSAAQLAASLGADCHDYLPYDARHHHAPVLDAVRPDLFVFAKLDLWPVLATEAAARGARTALAAGTVRPGSRRLRWPTRQLTRPGYAVLDIALAIATGDATRLAALGVPPDRITVVGDPRIDSAIAVVDAARHEAPLLASGRVHHTLVAGSTWPDDEWRLLEAFAELRASGARPRLILVPHQPTPEHLVGLDAAARRLELPHPARWSDGAATSSADLIVVDRMGLLARLYAAGSIAYVGGGFGTSGIHSVVEPAAWQRPVVVGPNDLGNREVGEMARAGGLVQLSPSGGGSELARLWGNWMADAPAVDTAGAAALASLVSDRGAADRSASALARLLPG